MIFTPPKKPPRPVATFWWRDGQQFCGQRDDMPNVRGVPGCGDRVAAYEAVMAQALGDAP
ncbi:hypothetical protein [Bradyrhizobium sp. McL0616]|uniref:hypothetical protein n=1 Tax=Bradyrhizobium sp. McL0616 TaxID=3415674 RepID=UPI003CF8AEB3